MVIIEKINWISKEAGEAEVLLSDGSFKILCFAHPFQKTELEEVTSPLNTLFAENIVRAGKTEYAIEKNPNEPFSYFLTGELIDRENQIIKIGEFHIELDTALPQGINIGEYISLSCDRIDLTV